MAIKKQDLLNWNADAFKFDTFLKPGTEVRPVFVSGLGALFAGDCMTLLPAIKSDSVDTVFADPPFNLGKEYGKSFLDDKPDQHYLDWCKEWVAECVRIVKPGGAVFIYNLPKWNVPLGAHLSDLGMEFRHWIAVQISAALPIPGRLHPSHYSLLYYTKGKPNTFTRIRTPIDLCRHCGGEVRDYGGHRHAMNPNGVTLKDVWTDIPPVRHWKYKSKARRANALSTKILDRVIEMSTVPGDIVLDPFGGSGTTYVVCEHRNRRWIGCEIDFAQDIIHRIESGEIKAHKNNDYIERD
jgi:site-specific DNA-methyltransferase (adenine-specific)